MLEVNFVFRKDEVIMGFKLCINLKNVLFWQKTKAVSISHPFLGGINIDKERTSL